MIDPWRWGWGSGGRSVAFWGWAEDNFLLNDFVPILVRGCPAAKTILEEGLKGVSVRASLVRGIGRRSTHAGYIPQETAAKTVMPGGGSSKGVMEKGVYLTGYVSTPCRIMTVAVRSACVKAEETGRIEAQKPKIKAIKK